MGSVGCVLWEQEAEVMGVLRHVSQRLGEVWCDLTGTGTQAKVKKCLPQRFSRRGRNFHLPLIPALGIPFLVLMLIFIQPVLSGQVQMPPHPRSLPEAFRSLSTPCLVTVATVLTSFPVCPPTGS